MPKYKVKYEIDVDADNPKEAALQVEQILNDMDYRPHLVVTDSDGNDTEIDLEQGDD